MLEAQGKARAMADRQLADYFLAQRELPNTQTNYDVRFYNIAIAIDDTNEVVSGCVTFVADAAEPTVSEIQVDLEAGMTVDSIVAPTGPLAYTQDDNIVIVTLDATYTQGGQFTFDFYYQGAPIETEA